jgi:hypothetical protein
MIYGQSGGRCPHLYPPELCRKKRITLMGVLIVIDALALIGLLICYGMLWRFFG